MNSGFLLSLAACVCAGAAGFYAGSVSTAPVAPTQPAPLSRVSSTPSPAQLPTERIAVVDMRRLFTAHPDTKPSEDAINAKRTQYKTEWQRLRDNGDATATNQFKELREKEIQDESNRRREQIVSDLRQRIRSAATNRNFNVVFDLSGKTLNGVPVVLHASGLPDITEDIIHELSR